MKTSLNFVLQIQKCECFNWGLGHVWVVLNTHCKWLSIAKYKQKAVKINSGTYNLLGW